MRVKFGGEGCLDFRIRQTSFIASRFQGDTLAHSRRLQPETCRGHAICTPSVEFCSGLSSQRRQTFSHKTRQHASHPSNADDLSTDSWNEHAMSQDDERQPGQTFEAEASTSEFRPDEANDGAKVSLAAGPNLSRYARLL